MSRNRRPEKRKRLRDKNESRTQSGETRCSRGGSRTNGERKHSEKKIDHRREEEKESVQEKLGRGFLNGFGVSQHGQNTGAAAASSVYAGGGSGGAPWCSDHDSGR